VEPVCARCHALLTKAGADGRTGSESPTLDPVPLCGPSCLLSPVAPALLASFDVLWFGACYNGALFCVVIRETEVPVDVETVETVAAGSMNCRFKVRLKPPPRW